MYVTHTVRCLKFYHGEAVICLDGEDDESGEVNVYVVALEVPVVVEPAVAAL